MAKWHINKNGEPAVCHAEVRACPCGDADHHFASKQDAEHYIEKQLKSTSGRMSKAMSKQNRFRRTFHNDRSTMTFSTLKPMRNGSGRVTGYGSQDSRSGCRMMMTRTRTMNGEDTYTMKISSGVNGPYKGRYVYSPTTSGDARTMAQQANTFMAEQAQHPTKLPQTAAKKQVEVKAAQWTGDPASMKGLQDLGMKWRANDDSSITIMGTLEGDLTYPKGSVVIQGSQGEFYANKDPKDFAKRYDAKGDGTFITKPSIIDTMEWSGDNLEDIQKFCPTAFIGDDGDLHVKTSWGETLRCKKGDRVSCYDPDKSDFAVIDQDVFRKTYDPMV